jgi:saccharopine dehydrogenase-like NADP-dependent oxidoreductase
MRLLMNDLKLNDDRATLKRILENAVPQTLQDVVVVYAAVAGLQDGELREENYVSKIYPQVIDGRLWSAIQVTTAAGLTSVLDLVIQGGTQRRGLVTQESFSMQEILGNRFGRYFAAGGTKDISGDYVARGAAHRHGPAAGSRE